MELNLNIETPENTAFLRGIVNTEIEEIFLHYFSARIEVVSQKELCQRFKIGPAKIIQMRNEGLFPFMRFGNKIRYEVGAVLDALQKREEGQSC